MRYTLVLHANGPMPQDFNVYLCDGNLLPVSEQETKKWWRIGMLQNVHLKARAGDFIPEVSAGFIGVVVNECPEPDLSEGLTITYLDFSMVQEEILTPITVYIRHGDKALGMVQEVDVNVDVHGKASVRLEAIDLVEWKDDLPKWVELKLIPLETD
jgi:hypothetical protein